MIKPENCYECEYYKNVIRNNEIIISGVCNWWDYDAYFVSKNQTSCMFKKPGRKLSLVEIEKRDEKELKEDKKFRDYLEKASKVFASWPKWKQTVLDWK